LTHFFRPAKTWNNEPQPGVFGVDGGNVAEFVQLMEKHKKILFYVNLPEFKHGDPATAHIAILVEGDSYHCFVLRTFKDE
jgi:hypothetical protein